MKRNEFAIEFLSQLIGLIEEYDMEPEAITLIFGQKANDGRYTHTATIQYLELAAPVVLTVPSEAQP